MQEPTCRVCGDPVHYVGTGRPRVVCHKPECKRADRRTNAVPYRTVYDLRDLADRNTAKANLAAARADADELRQASDDAASELEDYLAQVSDGDDVSGLFPDRLTVDPNGWITRRDLRNTYFDWAEDSPIAISDLYVAFEECGFATPAIRRGTRGFKGIRLSA